MVGTLLVFNFWMSLFSLTWKKKHKENRLWALSYYSKAMGKIFFLKYNAPTPVTQWSDPSWMAKLFANYVQRGLHELQLISWLLMSMVA